ncbi:MAG TPA: peptidase C11, partial [Ruminococcus sp.]|nr:peptidase C11 [Ruminococcus sp.]
MDQNRPKGREKNVTSGGSGVHRRGEGLGTGPVGSQNGYAGRTGGSNIGKRAAAGGGGTIGLLVIAFILLKSCGGNMLSDSGGLGAYSGDTALPYHTEQQTAQQYVAEDNTGASYDNVVATGSRDKRTQILGGGKDTVTMMVYVCGTDLESKSGMASSDMQEIAQASYGDNVNVILYTGGCNQWKISGISNSVNQIYQIKNGKLACLESDMGNKAMTDPATLSEFIQYTAKKFPANRNELIFWDHGGGS